MKIHLTTVRIKPEPGDAFEHQYPFVRDTFIEHYADGDGWSEREIQCWKPGVRNEMRGGPDGGDVDTFADGLGAQIVTVVGRFKPGRFPERVFFTRKWRDPDGKIFGKGRCHVTTINQFRSLTNGYRHPYKMAPTLLTADAPAGPDGGVE